MSQEDVSGAYAIEIVGLWKSYGGRAVLKRLDISVDWGQILVVFGANGSGKSTLIKLLSTLSTPTDGEIRVAGMAMKDNSRAIRRNIGVVMHQPLLYDNLTGRENLRFHGRMFSLDDLDKRIEIAAGLVGMAGFLDRRLGLLSHGLQKRFSMARAILHDPPILLLDEPETGLDQEALGLLKDLIVSSSGRQRTVVMTTHSLERGLAIGNRIAILAGGRIAYDEPRNVIDEVKVRAAYSNFTGANL